MTLFGIVVLACGVGLVTESKAQARSEEIRELSEKQLLAPWFGFNHALNKQFILVLTKEGSGRLDVADFSCGSLEAETVGSRSRICPDYPKRYRVADWKYQHAYDEILIQLEHRAEVHHRGWWECEPPYMRIAYETDSGCFAGTLYDVNGMLFDIVVGDDFFESISAKQTKLKDVMRTAP